MQHKKLWKLLKANLEEYKNLGIFITHRDIGYGDKYYAEYGEEYSLTINSDFFKIGYCYVTEDSDDWAQGESYDLCWCLKNDKEISETEMILILENIKSFLREKKINNILE